MSLAFNDSKLLFLPGWTTANKHRVDAGERRSFQSQAGAKGRNALLRTFDLEGDAFGIIANEAPEALFDCKPEYEGAETDALHDATYLNLEAFSFWTGSVAQEGPRRDQHKAIVAHIEAYGDP